MRCFFVRVHGKLDWRSKPETGALQPAGFYCHRYVLAPDEKRAIATAFRRVRDNLDRQAGWLRDGLATLELQADEVATAPMRKLLKQDRAEFEKQWSGANKWTLLALPQSDTR